MLLFVDQSWLVAVFESLCSFATSSESPLSEAFFVKEQGTKEMWSNEQLYCTAVMAVVAVKSL
jgi:hypothetical protein